MYRKVSSLPGKAEVQKLSLYSEPAHSVYFQSSFFKHYTKHGCSNREASALFNMLTAVLWERSFLSLGMLDTPYEIGAGDQEHISTGT